MSYDVIVLGVGGMGASALMHLAKRKLNVIGLERDEVPSHRGSSVGQTRIIRKAYYEDERYVPLLHRAYELWNELDASLYVRTGCLNLGPPDHPDIAGVEASVRIHHLPHTRLDEAMIRRQYPMWNPRPGDVGVYEEDAGLLRVEACTEAHAKAAVAAGAELRTQTRVTAVKLGPEVEVTLASGEQLRAKHLVLAAGPWLPGLDLAADLPPMTVTRQVQLWFEPRERALATPPAMPAFIHFLSDRAFYGLPLATGSVGVKVCRHHGGAATTADNLDRTVGPDDEKDVRAYIEKHLPNANGPLLHAQPCMYTSTADKHFVVGFHPKWPSVVVLGGFSGHGYKMASVLGEIAADLVVNRRTDLDIGLFDPKRGSR
jgi:sarcosine oxidase